MTASGRAKVWFVGAGPGAPDLVTVRGARAIAAADIVIWGANLVMEGAVEEHARPDAERIAWPPAKMDEILAAYGRAREQDLLIARLVGGDPAIIVDMSEELRRARDLGLPVEIVPGAGALSAAAAALGRELITARTDQSLLITSPRADLERLTGPGISTALYMGGRQRELQERLLSAGYPPETPCVIVASATWPEQTLLECGLGELEARLAEDRFDRRTLVLVGLPGGRGSSQGR